MRLSVNFLHFYLRARLHFHQAGDDHAIAGFQTIGNQPFVANRTVCLQRAQLSCRLPLPPTPSPRRAGCG